MRRDVFLYNKYTIHTLISLLRKLSCICVTDSPEKIQYTLKSFLICILNADAAHVVYILITKFKTSVFKVRYYSYNIIIIKNTTNSNDLDFA